LFKHVCAGITPPTASLNPQYLFETESTTIKSFLVIS
jgi:hypothetical protein